MALSGKLSEISAVEVLQLIALTGKTGRLMLRQDGRNGVVVVRKGRIVFAASDRMHSAVRTILSARTLIERDVVSRGLVDQKPRRSPSGGYEIDLGPPSGLELEGLVRDQIVAVVRELVTWSDGDFRFDSIDVPSSDEISIDAGGFALEVGLEPNRLLLDALSKLDENARRDWQKESVEPSAPARRPSCEISAAFEVLVDGGVRPLDWSQESPHHRQLTELKTMIGEVRSLGSSLSPELILLILRYAAQLLGRGVLFAVAPGELPTIGQFGVFTPGSAKDRALRRFSLDPDGDSVIATIVRHRRACRGRLEPTSDNIRLATALGGDLPFEMIGLPLLAADEVVAVLYGDHLPEPIPVGCLDGLEILFAEISIALEKARLEDELERLRSSRSDSQKEVG